MSCSWKADAVKEKSTQLDGVENLWDSLTETIDTTASMREKTSLDRWTECQVITKRIRKIARCQGRILKVLLYLRRKNAILPNRNFSTNYQMKFQDVSIIKQSWKSAFGSSVIYCSYISDDDFSYKKRFNKSILKALCLPKMYSEAT